jgi:hypothetical protein
MDLTSGILTLQLTLGISRHSWEVSIRLPFPARGHLFLLRVGSIVGRPGWVKALAINSVG